MGLPPWAYHRRCGASSACLPRPQPRRLPDSDLHPSQKPKQKQKQAPGPRLPLRLFARARRARVASPRQDPRNRPQCNWPRHWHPPGDPRCSQPRQQRAGPAPVRTAGRSAVAGRRTRRGPWACRRRGPCSPVATQAGPSRCRGRLSGRPCVDPCNAHPCGAACPGIRCICRPLAAMRAQCRAKVRFPMGKWCRERCGLWKAGR